MSTILGQRILPQANVLLGFSNYYVHAKGCLITELAEVLGITVEEVNDKLKTVNGFAASKTDPDNKCLVIWKKLEEAFPGITVNRVWSYNNDDALAQLAAGNSVLVEVPAAPIGGTGSHWVRYIGDHKLHDPWTASERPTSDFPNPTGYCVISGKWEPVQDVPPVLPVPPTTEEYKGLDLSNTESIKAAIDAWKDVIDGVYIRKDAICAALEVDGSYSPEAIIESIKTLKADFKTQVQVATGLPTAEQVEGQGPAISPAAVTQPTLKDVPQSEKDIIIAEAHAFVEKLKSFLIV